MKVTVSDDCIGCGLCASTCPDVFTMEGVLARAIASDITDPAMQQFAKQMVSDCPVNAITAQ